MAKEKTIFFLTNKNEIYINTKQVISKAQGMSKRLLKIHRVNQVIQKTKTH